MSFRRRRLVLAGAGALGITLAAPVPAPGDDGGADLPSTFGPSSHPDAFEYGVYEPLLGVDQRAYVAVRSLGLERRSRGGHGHRTYARFLFEVSNPTDEDLELLEDAIYLDWARPRRTPERGRAAGEVEGETELDPGESSRIRVVVPLGSGVEPKEVYMLRLRWSLASDTGTRVLLRSVFARRPRALDGPFLFVPFFDPFSGHGVIPRRRFRFHPRPFHHPRGR